MIHQKFVSLQYLQAIVVFLVLWAQLKFAFSKNQLSSVSLIQTTTGIIGLDTFFIKNFSNASHSLYFNSSNISFFLTSCSHYISSALDALISISGSPIAAISYYFKIEKLLSKFVRKILESTLLSRQKHETQI